MADSRPEEKANAPMGNIESPNCSIRERNAALLDASTSSFAMVMRGTGRCRRCLSLSSRVGMDTHRGMSVYASALGLDASITLVRVGVHRSFRATEEPPRFMRSEIGNNLPAGDEFVADPLK